MDLTDHVKDLDIEPAKQVTRCMKSMGKTMLSLTVQISGYCITIKMFDEAGIAYPDNLTWDEYEALAKNYLNQKNKYMVPINILGAQPFKRLLLLKTMPI